MNKERVNLSKLIHQKRTYSSGYQSLYNLQKNTNNITNSFR
jgi:hypothetical protein